MIVICKILRFCRNYSYFVTSPRLGIKCFVSARRLESGLKPPWSPKVMKPSPFRFFLPFFAYLPLALADTIMNFDLSSFSNGSLTTRPPALENRELANSHSLKDFKLVLANTDATPKEKRRIINTHNGKTALITTTEKKPSPLVVGSKSFPWIKHPSRPNVSLALVPLSYYQKEMDVELGTGEILRISPGDYKREQITITDSSKVKPDAAANERIKKELQESLAIYNSYTPTRYWKEPFIYPLDSVITSPFGRARIYNGEVKGYHAGTDFRAKVGTPIKAANDGVVMLAKERFLSGKSIVVSHGEGVFTQYYHCSELKVKVGDKVKRGQILALSGATGRVSGPHLHFGLFVHGVQVDPLQFIDDMKALF